MKDTQSNRTRRLGNAVETAWPFALTVGAILILLKLEWLMFDNGRSRYFFLLIAVLGVAWVLVLTIEKVRRLRALPGRELATAKVRTKLHSEVLAAMAIISFLGLFFRAGLDQDISNYRARLGYLNQAALELSQILPEDQCPKYPDSEDCKWVWSSMHGLQRAIGSAKETDVYSLMDSTTRALDRVSRRSSSQDQEILSVVRGNLCDAVIDERGLSVLFQALQLFAITFAVSAVSRKLALSWLDYQEKVAHVA